MQGKGTNKIRKAYIFCCFFEFHLYICSYRPQYHSFKCFEILNITLCFDEITT